MADPTAPPPGFVIQGGGGGAPPPPPPGFQIQDSAAPPPPPPGFQIQGAPPPAQRPAGATGFNMIGEMIGDLTNPNHPQHDPNALEQGLIDATYQPGLISGAKADYQNVNGLFMQPTRMAMEALGVGRQPGESNAALHARYGAALQASRQQAAAEVARTRIGQGPHPSLLDYGAQGLQAVIGFGAGIAANPQYFLLPGAGGNTVVGQLARAGAANAVVGETSDAAAQLMDMAEGDKKNFDIEQNLQQTAMGGLFGVAFHGATMVAPHVAPFVKGLFSNRGVDTLPPDDPRQALNISPMTQDHIAMNAADHAQYQQLLQTGSVDDIKGFFRGRNGPQPSWTEVNDWVQHRDSPGVSTNGVPGPDPTRMPEFNYNDEYNAHAEQQYREGNRQAVEDHVNAQMAGWKNVPNVEVVHGPEDIADPATRASVMAADPHGQGFGFLGADGTVRMYSGRIADADMANAVLYHEGLGHFGLEQQFGGRLDQVLNSLLTRNVSQFGRDVDAWQKANPNAYGGDRTRAAEEVLAEQSKNGQIKPTIQTAISSAVRQFGRKMGLKMSYSDDEVQHILAMAHDAVVNGKPGARTNGFAGSTPDPNAPNKFMFTGPKSKGYDPHDQSAYVASDGGVRNEISDQNAQLNPVNSGIHSLSDVLHHPELYERYPELASTPVLFSNLHNEGLAGQLQPFSDGRSTMYLDNSGHDPNPLGTALHEMQHAIQNYENPEAMTAGRVSHLDRAAYDNSPIENEARATEARVNMDQATRNSTPPKFMNRDALGREKTDPNELDFVDRLKADPRYWTDPDYRANVNEAARLRFPPEGPVNKFITMSQLAPKDVASEAFDRLNNDYTPSSRSWDQSIAAAKNTALNIDKLRSVRGAGNLDQRLFQYNGAAKNLNDQLNAAAQKVASGQPLTADEQADQIRNVANFHYVLGRIENDSAQIGRALNAMKAIDFSRNNLLNLQAALKASDSTLAGLSDPDTMNKFLKQYQLLGNTPGGQTLARDLSKPGWEKYALTLYRNMLLSGLGTHVKAPMDMATGITLDLEDRIGAIGIGKIHDALQAVGITKQGGMSGREPLGYLFGALRAITDGSAWTKAMQAMADPRSQTMRMTKEAPAVLPGLAGQITTLPTRLVAAQDAFFRAISTNAHLYGEGVAKSLAEGGNLSWQDHLDRGISYGQNPTDKMRDTAVQRANSALLLGDNPLTAALERAKQIPKKKNTKAPDPIDRAITSIIDLFTPIVRVPANSLLSRVIARSPLGFVDPETRGMLMAGGRQADIAISRMLVGTLKLGMMWAAADVTGNMLTGNNRKEAEAAGWRPNAVKENGSYETGNQLAASINPWDLHNSTATTVADIREAYKQGANQGQVGTALKMAGARAMTDMYNQLWTGDIGKAMGLFSDSPADTGTPTRVVGGVVSNMAVPAAIAQGRDFTDPYQRDTTVPGSVSGTIGNEIINRIPGLSNSLPARYSVYGDPMPTGASIIGTHNPITGGNRVQQIRDPAELEIDRLNTNLAKLKTPDDTSWPKTLITPVQRNITLDDGTKRSLTPAEFEAYQQKAGHYIVEDVRQEMSSPEWQSMSDHDRVLTIKSIETDQKANAREELFSQ